MAQVDFANEAKTCPKCGELKQIGTNFYKKMGTFDGYDDICRECKLAANRAKKAQVQSADEIINQIEDGKFEVDQKWLLKELIGQYKSPKCRDPLKALQMIKEVSGYNSNSTDDKAIMDSLLESMKDGRKEG
jgi:hypothetical protein